MEFGDDIRITYVMASAWSGMPVDPRIWLQTPTKEHVPGLPGGQSRG
jgi:hypothetical protein